MLTINAPAKVNLILEVLGQRGDYHDISSILQTVALFDTLTFEPAFDIEFSCSEPSLQEDNLVERVALALKKAAGADAGARIHLEKRIPWAAGLGGGSSDAAAALKGLNTLWRLGLSTERLVELAATLGSDVPAFVCGGTVRLAGHGDIIAPAPPLKTTYFVIVIPDVPVPQAKTAALYRGLQPATYTDGRYTTAALDALARTGGVPDSLLHNVFEEVMADCFSGIEAVLRDFSAASSSPVHLAGSGPALYAMFETEAEASRVASLSGPERRVFAVESIAASDTRTALRQSTP